jgi:hypothetical protein
MNLPRILEIGVFWLPPAKESAIYRCRETPGRFYRVLLGKSESGRIRVFGGAKNFGQRQHGSWGEPA